MSSQAVVARYIVALWQAGQDCRAHVAAKGPTAQQGPEPEIPRYALNVLDC
jgi:hypothetical protein